MIVTLNLGFEIEGATKVNLDLEDHRSTSKTSKKPQKSSFNLEKIVKNPEKKTLDLNIEVEGGNFQTEVDLDEGQSSILTSKTSKTLIQPRLNPRPRQKSSGP